MKRSSILAHRGLFSNSSEKNSLDALKRAIENGFGLETDVRDLCGQLVISHDPPKLDSYSPTLDLLLTELQQSYPPCRVALNVKSDGLANLVSSLFEEKSIDYSNFYFFDMSIPDTISYISSGMPIYSRVSNYEPEPGFVSQTLGVWLDDFSGSYPQVKRASELLESGLRVSVVSSELHSRNHSQLWNDIYESSIFLNPLFELCTDYPEEAAKLFSTPDKL